MAYQNKRWSCGDLCVTIVIGFTCSLITVPAAWGDVIRTVTGQSGPFYNIEELPGDYAVFVAIPTFDTSLGTLIQADVSCLLHVKWEVDVWGYNDDEGPFSFNAGVGLANLTFGGAGGLAYFDATGLVGVTSHGALITSAVSNIPGLVERFLGHPGLHYGPQDVSTYTTITITSPFILNNLGYFNGDGGLQDRYHSWNAIFYSQEIVGPGTSVFASGNEDVDIDILRYDITYTYLAVPEPASFAFFTLLAPVLISRHVKNWDA